MKKALTIIFILSIGLFLIVGCGSADTGTENNPQDTQNPEPLALPELQCGYDINKDKVSIDACDKSCVNDDDCQPFVGSCISIHEEPYFPEMLSVIFEVVDCSCADQVCVGKPTGEIAI